MLRFARRFLLG